MLSFDHSISNMFVSIMKKKHPHWLTIEFWMCVFHIEYSSFKQTYLPELNATHHERKFHGNCECYSFWWMEDWLRMRVHPIFASIICNMIFFLECVHVSSWMANFLWREVGTKIQIQSSWFVGLLRTESESIEISIFQRSYAFDTIYALAKSIHLICWSKKGLYTLQPIHHSMKWWTSFRLTHSILMLTT